MSRVTDRTLQAPQNGVSRQTTPRSPASSTPTAFVQTMATLCAMKRTADFTDQQMLAWFAALGHFPASVLSRAVVQLSLQETRFPELGDLYAICRAKTAAYAPNGNGDAAGKPSNKDVEEIARKLSLPGCA
jgi:hypothetical protein